MASYNGGPGRVQRAVKRSRQGRLLDAERDDRYLPRETRDYVPMILAAIIIAKNPAQYGFDVPIVPALATETVTCRRPSIFAASPNGPVCRWTTSSSSTPSSGAGRRRCGSATTC